MEDIMSLLSMGKHGVYVWSAYLIFFIAMGSWWFYLRQSFQYWIQSQLNEKRRAEAYNHNNENKDNREFKRES